MRREVQGAAATDQELGDDYSEGGDQVAWDHANQHWGKAEALRWILASMNQADQEEREAAP